MRAALEGRAESPEQEAPHGQRRPALPGPVMGRASPGAPRRRRPAEGAGTSSSLLTPRCTHHLPSPFAPCPQQGPLTILLPAAEETAPCEAGRGGRGSRRRGNQRARGHVAEAAPAGSGGGGSVPVPRHARPSALLSLLPGRLSSRRTSAPRGLVCRFLGSPFQYLTTLSAKKFFLVSNLNRPWHSLRLS